ncbi:MAG: hypothetical protein ACXW4B_05580 [Micavibrio sp.]
MRGDPLDPNHHVCRYCKGTYVLENGEPSGEAFLLDNAIPLEDNHISVNWLEYYLPDAEDRAAQMRAIREAFTNKGYTVRASARFAILPVRDILENFPSASGDVAVLHWPEENDPSHSGIFNLPVDADKDILQERLALVDWEMVVAKDP